MLKTGVVKRLLGHNLLMAALLLCAGCAGALLAKGAAAEQRTVEQVFKNIQTLKGMPDSQLIASMIYMQASVGAKDCDYCHVKSGENAWDFEKDDKPKKQTTRKMIQMVLDTNKSTFEGRADVTCFTCHQGHERPVAVPPLPRPAESTEAQPPRPAGPFPTPEQLLNKYVDAVGGKAAAEKFHSMVLKGTSAGPNATLPVEVYRKSPGKTLSTSTSSEGTFLVGFDGTSGWMQGGNATRDMDAADLAFMKDQEGVYDVIKIQEPFPRMRLAGKEKVGDRDAWILRAPGADGKIIRLYFDAETGILLRKSILTPSMIGAIPVQFDFEDYREVNGAKLPFTIRLSGLDKRLSWTRSFTEIKNDPSIEDGKFSKPAAGR
jgi:hypothetical protein